MTLVSFAVTLADLQGIEWIRGRHIVEVMNDRVRFGSEWDYPPSLNGECPAVLEMWKLTLSYYPGWTLAELQLGCIYWRMGVLSFHEDLQ